MKGDLISRQAAIELFNDDIAAVNELNNLPSLPDRMKYVQESVNTIMNTCKSDSIKDKAFRNVARMIQNAIDGEAPNFETIETLPSAQPGQRNARVFQGIIVEYPSISTYPEYEGKPYFSIKYTENGQGFIGYGTYKPEVLSEYLKEYFMPPTQPGWTSCKTALPEHDGEYLVTIKAFAPDQVVHTDIDIARFTDGKWRKGFPVTAWCELPKPWEGEGHE